MTAPRWIAEALDAAMADAHERRPTDDDLAAALFERLPLEAMGRCNSLPALIRVLTDGDPEVVQVAEFYQDASKMLDDAGAPIACAYPVVSLSLIERIKWLVEQRDAHGATIRAVDHELRVAGVPLVERKSDVAAGVHLLAQRLAVAEKSREHEAKEANRWAGEAREAQRLLSLARSAVNSEIERNAELRKERDRLADELHAARAKIAALITERDQIAAGAVDAVERQQAQAERIGTERVRLRAEIDKLTEERDAGLKREERDAAVIARLTREREDMHRAAIRLRDALEEVRGRLFDVGLLHYHGLARDALRDTEHITRDPEPTHAVVQTPIAAGVLTSEPHPIAVARDIASSPAASAIGMRVVPVQSPRQPLTRERAIEIARKAANAHDGDEDATDVGNGRRGVSSWVIDAIIEASR